MSYVTETLSNLIHQTAFFSLTWGNYLMIAVACVFLYLAIKKGFEPLLLVPIAFGMLLVNIYPDIMANPEDMSNGVGGLLHYFYILDEWSILPSLIFMGAVADGFFGYSYGSRFLRPIHTFAATTSNMSKILLIDGSNYLFRAFHGLPDLRTSSGEPTGAVRGFLGMLGKVWALAKPDHAVIIFDAQWGSGRWHANISSSGSSGLS